MGAYRGELNRLHKELSELYRAKSVDWPQINRYWIEIDRLEALEGEDADLGRTRGI